MEGTLHLFALARLFEWPECKKGYLFFKGMFACQLGSVGARVTAEYPATHLHVIE